MMIDENNTAELLRQAAKNLEKQEDEINKLKNEGLIEEKDGKIQLTEKGDPWRFNISWEFFKNSL